MPRACTVKGMLLKCVKSWLYSCSFYVHKKSWNPSVKLAVPELHAHCQEQTYGICACLPFVRFLSWSLWSSSWNIDVRRLFFFIYRRWPHFFRTVCKEEICAEALTYLQCRPNFCSRVSACGSFGFFKCASPVLFSVFVQIYTFLYPSAHFPSLILSLCSLFFVLLKTPCFVPLQRFLHCIIFSLITC